MKSVRKVASLLDTWAKWGRARHTYDPYSTHQPVLCELVKRTTGPIVEFGCGFGSTELLHRLCAKTRRRLLTLETNAAWYEKFTRFRSDWHEMILVDDWVAVLKDERIVGTAFDVAFIDQEPWEARHLAVKALKDTCRFVVLHDCDYFPEHGVFGASLSPLRGTQDRGQRTYDDVFRFYQEFFPLDPWPFERTGPPTLPRSNLEPCDLRIDFRTYIRAKSLY